MADRTRLGSAVALAAIVLGAAGDALLRAPGPWGLNALLWVAGIVLAVAFLVRRLGVAWPRDATGLLVIAVVLAAGLAWRDSMALKAIDLLAVAVALALPVLRTGAAWPRRSGLTDYASAGLFVGLNAAFGSALLLDDVDWKGAPRGVWWRRGIPIVRGLLLALPLLVVFGGLFAAADAAFANLAQDLFDFDLGSVLGHVMLAAFFTWIAGGYLRGVLSGAKPPTVGDDGPGRRALGIVEIGTVLGLLDALFLSFLAVQVRYRFGGQTLVEATTGLTYAEYARQGFFELVAVAALVLPVLLAADWLFRAERPVHARLFRLLAGAQVLLLFAIMASALQRMRLYQSAYGLTELRFYTTAFMLWLGAVFVWFTATILRGRRARFAFGGLVTGFAAVALLNLVNPDALIVRANAGRAADGRGFDPAYAVSLSADAVPVLVTALPDLDPRDRCIVAARILDRWSPAVDGDWRTANVGRWAARRAVRDEESRLREIACDPGNQAAPWPRGTDVRSDPPP